jgi:hypothetical protein
MHYTGEMVRMIDMFLPFYMRISEDIADYMYTEIVILVFFSSESSKFPSSSVRKTDMYIQIIP